MSEFQQLDQALQPVVVNDIPADRVAWVGEDLDDETALQIVLHDVQKAQAFVQEKNMVIDWERAENNFRAAGIPKTWQGSESLRAGLSIMVVLEAVEKLLAALMLAFFSDPQPFLLKPTGKTSPQAARAKANLLRWGIKESGFKEEIRRGLKGCLLYGFTTFRRGWKTVKRIKKTFAYAEGQKGVKKTETEYEVSHPTFEYIPIRNYLGDPSLQEQNVRKGRFSVAQIFPDASILDQLRDDPAYKNVPSREEMALILSRRAEPATDSMSGSKYMTWRDNQAAPQTQQQSVDPTKAPLEILEWEDGNRVITVLQRCIVIRNSPAELGKTSFLSCAFIDVPGAMYGFGVSKLLAPEQYLQTSVMNSGLDGVALQLNMAFTAEQGLQTTAQSVRVQPGKIITGPQIKPIVVPDITPVVERVMADSEARAARRVGAEGGSNMPTQALRTAEGVQSFGQDVVNKLQYFIEIFAENVYIPALEEMLETILEKLQPEDIKNILADNDAKALEQLDILEVYNGTCGIEVLSSTKLAARRAAAQLAPLIMQLVMAPAVQQALAAQGVKFNFAEFLEECLDLAGWDVNSLIVPASQVDIQRAIAIQAPQAVKAQSDAAAAAQLQDQKHQDDLEDIEETGLMKAGVAAIAHVLKASHESEIPNV